MFRGQWGLNPGVIPEAGRNYANMPINYSANKLNDSNNNHRPNILGTYAFWVDENIFLFVPKGKFFGAYYAPYISINPVTGSLVADLASINLGAAGRGSGLGDTWVEPANLGWRLKRAGINLGYAFMAPTGRFVPGASDNVGSGYWGNNLRSSSLWTCTRHSRASWRFLLWPSAKY